jgi:hypothetical protein
MASFSVAQSTATLTKAKPQARWVRFMPLH